MNFDSANLDLIGRLALALALGLLIGIERGWREREEPPGGRTAGIRSFALLGLAGGLAGALVAWLGVWPSALIMTTLGAAVAVFSYRENKESGSFSVTTVIVVFIVLLLGAYAVVGEIEVAAALGVATVALLAARESLHRWLARLTWEELRSGILLLAMTFIALPILPDRAVDPWGAINPHEIWLMAILIAAISAAGYATVRIGGPQRGLIYGSLAGALVSSTAVTFANAHRSRAAKSVIPFASAAALASGVSLVRTATILLVVTPLHSTPFLVALLPPALITFLVAALLWLRRSDAVNSIAAQLELGNPFDLGAVLRFAALLGLVLALTKFVQAQFGDPGFLGLAAIAGAFDIDPIALAAARLAGESQAQVALAGVLVALLLNMTTKLVVGFYVGGVRFGLLHLALLVPAVLVLVVWLVPRLLAGAG